MRVNVFLQQEAIFSGIRIEAIKVIFINQIFNQKSTR